MRWLLLCLLSVLLIGFVSAAPHAHNGFSVAESGFVVSDRSVNVVDDAIFHTGYYASEGDVDWTPFELSGASPLGSADWIIDSGQYTLPSLSGEYYVVVYSCTNNGGWDCHGGMWQLHVISNGGSGLVASFDFETAAGGSLQSGASLTTDAARGSVLSPNGGAFVVPDSSALDIASAISLSVWVRLDSFTENGKILSKPTDGNRDPYEVYALDVRDGDIRFVLTDGSSEASGGWHAVRGPISLNSWHHVAGTYDGSMMKLYVDGLLTDFASASFISSVITGFLGTLDATSLRASDTIREASPSLLSNSEGVV